MNVTAIGIDSAKTVFQVHGVDQHGKVVLRRQLKRHQMAAFFANLQPCLIGMEACGGAHHWARKLGALGHTVRLMAPQFVKPYVKTNKNDVADAEAMASVGRGQDFENGRQVAAWLGLVPGQHSSGGKAKLLGISKRGDAYLRTLLIHGARSVIQSQARKAHQPEGWLQGVLKRRHKNVAAVALANKNARIAWALLAHQGSYDKHHVPTVAASANAALSAC